MASTSVAETMEHTPNWLEMPDKLMLIILHKLGTVEILKKAQLVCTNWRSICKDPALSKLIIMCKSIDSWRMDELYVNRTKEVVYRSSGELNANILKCFPPVTYLIIFRNPQVSCNIYALSNCYHITGCGSSDAVKRLQQLEHLSVYHTDIDVQDIKVIGQTALSSRVKSFRSNKEFDRDRTECDVDAFGVASSMPELSHLQLHGNKMTDEGLQAILHGCPHLKSHDVRRCFNLNITENLVKLCMKRIKNFKCPNEDDFSEYRFYGDYEYYCDTAVSEEDYNEYYE